MNHTEVRYLEAKRSVDDRARSRRIRDRTRSALAADPRILDIGCGTGTTVPRLVEWGIETGSYRGVDSDAGIISFARDVRPKELRRAGHAVTRRDRGFTVDNLSVVYETGEALETLDNARGIDLVIAQAFADLVDISELLSAVESALAPSGLAYLPITFDGRSIFQPEHPADEAITAAYHGAIDAAPGRDARAGRHLIDACRRADGDLLAVAPADWIVRPRGGTYPADEAYFLRCILGFVENALSTGAVAEIEDWLATRRDQLAAGELTYIAHQYDLLYRAWES